MFLAVAAALFAAFFAHVLAGASWRMTVLSDVQEMLLLLLACLFFVAACLRAQRRDQRQDRNMPQADKDPRSEIGEAP